MIRSTLRDLFHGVELRYLPIAMPPPELFQVKTFLVDGDRDLEVTGLDMPASLVPLVIGLRESAVWPYGQSRHWRFEVRTPQGLTLGSMTLVPAGRISLGGVFIRLFRPQDGLSTCVTGSKRMWRYLLAWRRARVKKGAPGLAVTFADLRALDVYYQRPRPVWLVTVPHLGGFNIFPMDLLDSIDGPERLFLALRSTSPSIPFLRQRCSIALSAVAADLKPVIYALGSHHRAAYNPDAPLPFETVKSATGGLAVPVPAFIISEWRIQDCIEVGSHTCFIADRVNETVQGTGSQLAHISELLAIRLAAMGTPLRTV
ncbi:MAG: hypothetical protein WA825_12765 [Steroidobacteraceae bacterium]